MSSGAAADSCPLQSVTGLQFIRIFFKSEKMDAVREYLEKQGDSVLKKLFTRYATKTSAHSEALIKAGGLQNALSELGVTMELNKVETLMERMDLDENGGLDYEEFKRAAIQPPTQLEQWASMLPIAGLLARSLPVSAGPGDQPLRDFSRLDEDTISTAVDVFSWGLKRLLLREQAILMQVFKNVDEKATAAKDEAVSVVTKFKTFKHTHAVTVNCDWTPLLP